MTDEPIPVDEIIGHDAHNMDSSSHRVSNYTLTKSKQLCSVSNHFQFVQYTNLFEISDNVEYIFI